MASPLPPQRTGSRRRMPLVLSFATVSLLMTVGLGTVLGLQIDRAVRQRSVTDLKRTTASSVALAVRMMIVETPQFKPGSVQEELVQVRLINTAAEALVGSGGAVAVEATLPNGFVVGGANGPAVGTMIPVDPLLRSALSGKTSTLTIHRDGHAPDALGERLLRTQGGVLVLQRGVRMTPGGPIAGAVRVYALLAPSNREAASEIRTDLLVLAVGLLIFWLVLFRLVSGAARRIREQSQANEYLALHDSLTGLPNRVLLRQRTDEAIEDAALTGSTVTLILMDLDLFKDVNDILGYEYGDRLLQLIGPRLQAHLRDTDTVARLGGDEFAVLIPDLPDGESPLLVAGRLSAAMAQSFTVDGVLLDVSGAIGVSAAPADAESFNGLLRNADVAMHEAKQHGREITEYAPELNTGSATRLTMLGELRRGIDTPGELVLHYQPKADLPSGAIKSVEALVRWQHPERGLLPPGEFIPLAESTGLIRPLTMAVMRVALAQIAAWAQEGLFLRVAVNVSAKCLSDNTFPDQVLDLLRQAGVPVGALEIEITESAIMSDPERALGVLEALHAAGISLAIDDFGTGYSSMAYLKRLPINDIKIDRAFVTNMDQDASDAAIVRTSIQLAHSLGMSVVAEGVETGPVLAQLTELGCDHAQGYYLSKPLPAGELAEWVRRYDGTGRLLLLTS
jgi:diguanylate cyclase (GGDEF)-like protein